MPDKLVNTGDVLLMRFWSKNDRGCPWSLAFANEVIGFVGIDLGLDDFTFMMPVVWLAATHGLGSSRVQTELEPEDGSASPGGKESIPVIFDD